MCHDEHDKRGMFEEDDQGAMDPGEFEAMMDALEPLGRRFYCRPEPAPDVYGQTFGIGEEGEGWHKPCATLSPDEVLEVITEGRAWLKSIGREVDDGSGPR